TKSVRLPVSSHSPTSSRTAAGRSRISSRFSISEKSLQIRAKLLAEIGMVQREIDRRLQVAEFLARVVTATFEDLPVAIALTYELAHSVGELNLTTRAPLGLRQQRKD